MKNEKYLTERMRLTTVVVFESAERSYGILSDLIISSFIGFI